MLCNVIQWGDECSKLYNQQELTVIQLRYRLTIRVTCISLYDCIAVWSTYWSTDYCSDYHLKLLYYISRLFIVYMEHTHIVADFFKWTYHGGYIAHYTVLHWFIFVLESKSMFLCKQGFVLAAILVIRDILKVWNVSITCGCHDILKICITEVHYSIFKLSCIQGWWWW